MSNINHELSTKYLKAIYFKFQSAIADYKSDEILASHPLFSTSGHKAKALEQLLDNINLIEWMKDIEQLEKEIEDL